MFPWLRSKEAFKKVTDFILNPYGGGIAQLVSHLPLMLAGDSGSNPDGWLDMAHPMHV